VGGDGGVNWGSRGGIFKSRDPSVGKDQTSRLPIMKVLSLLPLLVLEIVTVVNGLGVTQPPKGAVVVDVYGSSGSYKTVIHPPFALFSFTLLGFNSSDH